jgi:hypothetical protein
MSRKKRVTRRLSDDEELVLCDGGGIISFTTLEEVFGDLENAREAWRVHGERLTAEYRPGFKPWGWWQFTATEAEKEKQKEAERAFLERQQRELRTQPEGRDPVGRLIPFTKRLYFPHRDGDSNGHATNGNHDY